MNSLEVFKSKLAVSDIPSIVDKLKTLPQVECEVTNHFADGQYLRETHMPAGTFAIGKKHKFSTINIILKGKLSVYNGPNSSILHIEAPYIWVSEPGVQKMAFFSEDTVWLNPHPTDSTDLVEIENKFIDNEKEIIWAG